MREVHDTLTAAKVGFSSVLSVVVVLLPLPFQDGKCYFHFLSFPFPLSGVKRTQWIDVRSRAEAPCMVGAWVGNGSGDGVSDVSLVVFLGTLMGPVRAVVFEV